MFQELESADEDRLMTLENIQANKAKVSKLYNKKVRLKRFAEGDLVWKIILPIKTRTTKFNKWSPNQEGPFIITQVIYGGTYKLPTLEGEELARSINGKYLKKYYPMIGEAISIKENEGVSHKLAKQLRKVKNNKEENKGAQATTADLQVN